MIPVMIICNSTQLETVIMNDEDIRQFLTAFGDFMEHSETEIRKHEDLISKWEEARKYTEGFYEEKAAELEVTVDYYMAGVCMTEKGDESFWHRYR
jgi:hypothetical protein